jgi:hypothetical protein
MRFYYVRVYPCEAECCTPMIGWTTTCDSFDEFEGWIIRTSSYDDHRYVPTSCVKKMFGGELHSVREWPKELPLPPKRKKER